MRSASAPQAWRATKAAASITDSMTALWVGLMPMPLQNATRCADGYRHGNAAQEAGEADQRLRRRSDAGRRRDGARLAADVRRLRAAAAIGAGFSSKVAGRMATSTTTA